MSEIIDRWIDYCKSHVPEKIQNTKKWKKLLTQAVNADQNLEVQRLQILMHWMWEDVLPAGYPAADKGGFGNAWRVMLALKSEFPGDLFPPDNNSSEASESVWLAGYSAWHAASHYASLKRNPDPVNGLDLIFVTSNILSAAHFIAEGCELDGAPFDCKLDWYNITQRLIAADKY